MPDFAEQRKNMVESQVRPSDVSDRRVVRAMQAIPRELFVPEDRRFLAYADQDVPVAEGRALMAPRLLARLLQNLDIGEADLALEVGSTTGYGAAVLSRLAQTVVALEADVPLSKSASDILTELEIDNAVVVTGKLPEGYPDEGPYDVILVSGQVSEVPDALLDQLKHGGRLITVMARDRGLGEVVRWQRYGETFDKRVLFEASTAALPGFQKAPQFVF